VIERDISKLEAVQKPFPRISYDDAVKTLQAKGCRSSGAATSAARTKRRCRSSTTGR
jgi:aspartyl/asparaginyl-tRNA synthetase